MSLERRRQGPSAGPIPEEIEVFREPGESDDEHVRSVVDQIVEAVRTDAARPRARGHVGTWIGVIVFLDHTATKKPELARLDVRIEDPDEAISIDGESVALVNTCRALVRDVSVQFVSIMAAAKDREAALADLVGAVAKHVTSETAERHRYEYKTAKMRARLEEQRIDEEARVHRHRAWAETARTYEPVVEQWSRWAAEQQAAKKSGGPPPTSMRAPTQAEIDAVFGEEKHDALRAIASRMIAEPQQAVRMTIAAEMRAAVIALDATTRMELQLRAVAKLGEQRAKECYAWLAAPLTDPS